jgi:hypothetical protein
VRAPSVIGPADPLRSRETFWAERYVYSNKDDFALAKDILNEDPMVRRGPRMRVN